MYSPHNGEQCVRLNTALTTGCILLVLTLAGHKIVVEVDFAQVVDRYDAKPQNSNDLSVVD